MTLKEQIIYNKLMKYALQDEITDTVYISDELKLSIRQAEREFHILNMNQENPFYRPLQADIGFLSKLKIFVKRVIRKLNVFYIKPICDQQTIFNAAVVKNSQELLMGERIINDQLVVLVNQISDLKEELLNCRRELDQMKKCVYDSKAKIEDKNTGNSEE